MNFLYLFACVTSIVLGHRLHVKERTFLPVSNPYAPPTLNNCSNEFKRKVYMLRENFDEVSISRFTLRENFGEVSISHFTLRENFGEVSISHFTH